MKTTRKVSKKLKKKFQPKAPTLLDKSRKILCRVYNLCRVGFWMAVHNGLVHPLTVILHLFHLSSLGTKLHDLSLPKNSAPWNIDYDLDVYDRMVIEELCRDIDSCYDDLLTAQSYKRTKAAKELLEQLAYLAPLISREVSLQLKKKK